MSDANRGPRRRRTILLKFNDDVAQDAIDDLWEKIRENFESMKGLVELEMGPQTFPDNDFTHMISFVLEDDEALRIYREDQQHQDLRKLNYDLLAKNLTAEVIL